MKRRLVLMTIVMLLLVGCSTKENETEKTVPVQKLSEVDYRKRIEELTDKEIDKILVEDFGNNGEKEAFVLTKKGQEEYECSFELWFLNSSDSEKIIDTFIATDNTSIEVFNAEDKYVLFNISQIRQNDEMKTAIYGVADNKAVELFSQKRINLSVENDELCANNGSYYVWEPELKGWTSLCEQIYHFKWDNELKTCTEYEADVISEERFMEMSKAGELKEKINQEVNKRHIDEVTDTKYSYLLREDETVDVNIIVSVKDGSRYKYHVTVPYKDNTLGTDVELSEGNKEESLIQYLKSIEEK